MYSQWIANAEHNLVETYVSLLDYDLINKFLVIVSDTANDNDRIRLNNVQGRFTVEQRTGILSIFNTIRNDSGTYECQAENILGLVTARTSLLVRRK
jgi:hypothetical protein